MSLIHEKTVTLLSNLVSSGNLPHTLLFTGPDRANKREIAIEFAKYLFHEGGRFNEFYKKKCSCDSCIQVNGGLHPDFYLLEEYPIQIKQVRDLIYRFSLAPFYASRKIAIIENAEGMRLEAANAFLKTIEEPRGNALFILVAYARISVLPTISSRAFEIRFVPQKEWHRRFLAKGDIVQKIKVFESANLSDMFLGIQKYNIQNKEELVDLLDVWLIKLRECLLSADDMGLGYRMMKHILYAKQLILTTNTNPQLIMEELCVTHYS